MKHDLVRDEQHGMHLQALLDDVREYIGANFLSARQSRELDDHADLMESGALDSLAFIELVAEMERRHGMAIRDTDVTKENFGTIHAIASYVHRTQQR